jgi:ribosomal protein S18 acetylase RimI-like enzyme
MKAKVERSLHYKEKATPEEESVLIEGIIAEASKAKKIKKITPFAFFIKDPNRKILGGIKGTSYYGCLYIDSLWVDPTFRTKGWGGELMHAAENLGRKRNCSFISLTTMDWEALDFYKNLGYDVEFVREGFEKNSKMYLLRKNLQ